MKEKWMDYAGRHFTVYFVMTGIICLSSFLIRFAGDSILASKGLQWRNWVNMTLALLWMGGGLLFLAGIPVLLLKKTKGSWKVRVPAAVVAIALIIGIATISRYVAFFFLFGDKPESVVEWNGQKCVTSDLVWFDTTRSWYAYHGWFVMGRDILHFEEVQ